MTWAHRSEKRASTLISSTSTTSTKQPPSEALQTLQTRMGNWHSIFRNCLLHPEFLDPQFQVLSGDLGRCKLSDNTLAGSLSKGNLKEWWLSLFLSASSLAHNLLQESFNASNLCACLASTCSLVRWKNHNDSVQVMRISLTSWWWAIDFTANSNSTPRNLRCWASPGPTSAFVWYYWNDWQC